MRICFVGGFLGSGKTTAIAEASRLLLERGLRVGIVTNDQGKLQVDGLFLRAAGLPAVEVSGGCFCCRYDDFDARIASLVETELPDLIFAESVGSCADLIATVIKPFEAFRERYGSSTVFTVLADSRLLLARLAGRALPFSEDLLYLFDRQLEEAEVLVLNKVDLLAESELARLEALADAAWPTKRRLALSGSTRAGARLWLSALEGFETPTERPSLDIDYARYGSGERELSWLDERLVIEDHSGLASDGGSCREAILVFVGSFARGLSEAGLPVGHLKLEVSAFGYSRKLSLSSGDFLAAGSGGDSGGDSAPLTRLLEEQLPPFTARRVEVTVNARIQAGPEELAALAAAAARSAVRPGLRLREEARSAFRPGLPEPTHRLP